MGIEAGHRGGRGRADLGQTDNCSVFFFFLPSFRVLLIRTKCVHEVSTQVIFLAMQPGVRLGDSDGQLGCSFLSGSPVLGGDIVSSLGTGRFVEH